MTGMLAGLLAGLSVHLVTVSAIGAALVGRTVMARTGWRVNGASVPDRCVRCTDRLPTSGSTVHMVIPCT